ncbi:MAG: ral secretion pathway protein [Rhodospirillaceae bacterium]|jgi:general secretion pathway protein G|nr:ral secretion pathway protein [Rhodospirillaceae bacterium]
MKARVHGGSRQQGFTLVELLVVLAILGLLATLVAPRLIKYLGQAKTQTAKLQIQKLSGILDIYHLDVGRYPAQETGIEALAQRPAELDNWNGPYVKKQEELNDPWGHIYIYRSPGQHGDYDLYSLGADGKEGGEGEDRDVTNW